MLAIGNQVKVIGELHRFGNFLKDVNTEPLAALFDVTWLLICFIPKRLKEQTNEQTNNKTRLYTRGSFYPLTFKLPPQSRASPSQLSTMCIRPE